MGAAYLSAPAPATISWRPPTLCTMRAMRTALTVVALTMAGWSTGCSPPPKPAPAPPPAPSGPTIDDRAAPTDDELASLEDCEKIAGETRRKVVAAAEAQENFEFKMPPGWDGRVLANVLRPALFDVERAWDDDLEAHLLFGEDATTHEAALREAGIVVVSASGSMATVRFPGHRLGCVAGLDFVVKIEGTEGMEVEPAKPAPAEPG